MLDSIDIGTSGLLGFSKELQTISNNVANLNTPGFKGSNSEFSDLFSQGGNGTVSGQGGQIGSGLATLPSVINFTQGQINQTGNDLDTAIEGSGFFVLRDTAGQVSYTRDGAFKFDADGILVNANGDHVQALNAKGALQDITLTGSRFSAPKASTAITMAGSLSTADTSKVVSVTVIDSSGASHVLSVDFKNNTATTPGEWGVTVTDGATTLTAAGDKIDFTNGAINSAHDSVTFTFAPAGAASMSLTLTMDPSTTSPATGTSDAHVTLVDGYGKGEMTKTTFDAGGNLVVSYSNGQTVKNQQLALATFNSTAGLYAVSGNDFKNSDPQAVTLSIAQSGVSTIDAASLEASNVDLSKEFSAIIITQRGYQASSELISTANQMLDTLMHMKG